VVVPVSLAGLVPVTGLVSV
jgi:hypothetical protein